MEPYIYGVKQNIHIVDLEITHKNLEKACEFLYETAAKGGQIIFVGTKKQAHDIVSIEAKRSGAMYVIERWIGGTITNHRVIRLNIDKLLTTIRKKELGELDKYTKKERLLIDREVEKLQRSIGGITALKGVPAALVVVDAKREKTAVREATTMGVTMIALVDSNVNPKGIRFVIPGNDDAVGSLEMITKLVAGAVTEGKAKAIATAKAASDIRKSAEDDVKLAESSKAAVEDIDDATKDELAEKAAEQKSETPEKSTKK